ncbi:HXXEE domain-containing protein [Staphylococcus pettenkoferi]|uniref:HXXEE domain-containing protein n=1 Tax=Staphylococcus pettenkoferi TaxID=170573 RepID=A0A9Q4D744_9STAP|nr:HXXEE domain-containing protein [Staphylococcus pettenkoferi]MCY1569963.1 HXXEE domain-containing protein [Staphylococcus pettenkoferi]MCY1576273.1 HXXEE domain-containing protein [Staphylococcus pettenkoferi]MCY1594059.1 HXXEE domain-containing protein [Staphylococcus pettenkoferi]MCY1616849.1 HXXEE domain-containing protein [Staphylococcus pettenkoferi]
MKLFLRHFYNISVAIGIIIIIGTIIIWQDINALQRLALLNLAVINFHFFEEFGYPGGFPKFANTIFAYKNSPRPDRFPLNQMSAFLTNWGTALVLYIPPIIFPEAIWFGLAPILFGGLAQLIVHAIVNNKMLGTYYNAGLATVVFGHLPIAIIYIIFIHTHNLVSFWDYVIGVVIMVLWYVVGIRIFINKGFESINSSYPFTPKEMAKFNK